jgi:hypothetical protein
MMQRELIAFISEQSLELDWQEAAEPLSEQQVLLQDRLADRAAATGDWLLSLGAADPAIPLSASLTYLRAIGRAFLQALTQDPGIEFTRGRTQIPLDEQTSVRLLAEAPYLPSEFTVTSAWLQSVWQQLQDTFVAQIECWPGTVEAYLQHLAPDLHAADRICFHLVENKDPAAPFAFLATCAARDARTGQLRQVPLLQILQELAGAAEPAADPQRQPAPPRQGRIRPMCRNGSACWQPCTGPRKQAI